MSTRRGRGRGRVTKAELYRELLLRPEAEQGERQGRVRARPPPRARTLRTPTGLLRPYSHLTQGGSSPLSSRMLGHSEDAHPLLGGCSPFALRMLRHSGDVPSLKGCSPFTSRMLILYLEDAHTLLQGCSGTQGTLSLIPTSFSIPYKEATHPLPRGFLVPLRVYSSPAHGCGACTWGHQDGDRTTQRGDKRTPSDTAEHGPTGRHWERWEALGEVRSCHLHPFPTIPMVPTPVPPAWGDPHGPPTMSLWGTHVKAKATSAPLTTMKSRMFHRSRK